MSHSVVIYARTSPDCTASCEHQIQHLKTVAAEHGWSVAQVFTDRPTSVRGPAKRPGEAALINAIRNGTVDRVLVCSICRMGQSLIGLVGFLEICRLACVPIWVDEHGIDTEQSNTLFEASAAMALHLRQSRRDRILRGQAAARALSIRCGRPPIPAVKVERAKKLLATGKGVREVARMAGISVASASRLKNSVGSTTVGT